jgi:nucleoside-diphosphate-sugar epimerase
MVDVRDLAVAHVLAYEKPEAGGQRYIIAKDNYDWQEVLSRTLVLSHSLKF